MIIHQQSIIDFNISFIEGSNTNINRLTFVVIKDIIQFLKKNLFIEYFNITKGLFLYVKDLMKIDL
jgi:hypothetical protein